MFYVLCFVSLVGVVYFVLYVASLANVFGVAHSCFVCHVAGLSRVSRVSRVQLCFFGNLMGREGAVVVVQREDGRGCKPVFSSSLRHVVLRVGDDGEVLWGKRGNYPLPLLLLPLSPLYPTVFCSTNAAPSPFSSSFSPPQPLLQ